MTFANPAMLWGAALAALPLLVHLFNRRRARPHPFAAIDFVLRSRRRTARKLRLKRILLFLSRTLLLIAVPLALARPQPARTEQAVRPSGPMATALVLDTSLSMSYELAGRPLLARAKQMARDALAGLAPEEPVTFVSCDPDAPPPAAPGFDRAQVREALDLAPQTFAPQDLTTCLGRAARVLGESTLPGKRIALATDLTASAFRLDVPAPTIATSQGEVRPEVVLLDAAGGAAELPNLAVVGLRVEAAPAIGSRAFQFTLTVANGTKDPVKDLQATLKVGGVVVAKAFLEIPARGTAVKTLAHRFPQGGGVFAGQVSIASDALAADDTRYFSLRVPRDVTALVVDGAPNTVRFRDEAFFVEAALTAHGSPVRPTLRDAETAEAEKLADYDLVMLLNVRALSAGKVAELSERVKKGGGLFVSLGDQVDADAYNDALGQLLPRKLRLVKTAADRKEEDAEARAARLAQVAFDHPAFSVFTGEAREGMLASRTYRYFLLEPGAGDSAALASFDDGAPALVEARRGKGRVALYTSTVDRDWSDWPIRTSFLPAVQRLSGWLAGALDERATEQALVGEQKPLELPAGLEGLSFKAPDGKELTSALGSGGKPFVSGLKLPGVYAASGKLNGQSTALPELSFAVNVDPRESELARLDERELKAYFGEKTRTQRGGSKDEAPPPFPTWSALLALGAAFFFVEGLLTRK